jgi:hypothetical protein
MDRSFKKRRFLVCVKGKIPSFSFIEMSLEEILMLLVIVTTKNSLVSPPTLPIKCVKSFWGLVGKTSNFSRYQMRLFATLMGTRPHPIERFKSYPEMLGRSIPDQIGRIFSNQNSSRDEIATEHLRPQATLLQNLPSNITPFTRTQGYVPLSRPNVSASMNVAGQQYYQTPTSLGANYIGAPTNIAPITQGFQPVGQPSVPSYYPQSFQPMGGKGGFQFQPQSRSQELPSQQAPTQQFQPMGGKGVPRAITGKGG